MAPAPPPVRTLDQLRADLRRALDDMESQYLKLCMATSASSKDMKARTAGRACFSGFLLVVEALHADSCRILHSPILIMIVHDG